MTETSQQAGTDRRLTNPVLWRVAGGVALAHVVLLFAGLSQERSTGLGDGLAAAHRAYAQGSLGRIMAGGYVESFAFVVLVPALVFVGRAVGRRTEAARWAGQTSLAAGIGYVAVTLAVGLPAGAAALYGGHHGADLRTALMVTDIRNFAFFLSLMLLGLQAAGLGIAAYLDGFATKWVGIGGVVVGLLLFGGVAGSAYGLQNDASMLWMVWWVGVAICLIRNPSRPPVGARP